MSSDPNHYFGFTFDEFTDLDCRAFSLSVTLIKKKNKGLTQNQSGSTVKLVKPVLNPVEFYYSKWQTNLVW